MSPSRTCDNHKCFDLCQLLFYTVAWSTLERPPSTRRYDGAGFQPTLGNNLIVLVAIHGLVTMYNTLTVVEQQPIQAHILTIW